MKTYRKGELIHLYRTVAASAALMLPLLWGCEPADPGSALANRAPETRVVVAPLDDAQHDHYISPEMMFRVQWFGSDPDGQVKGYYLQVDAGPWIWTTKTDSAMAFESSTPDPNNAGKTLPAGHTIRVKAVDDSGIEDPTPAERGFSAVNYIPVINEFVADFRNNAVIGQGVSFSIDWSDSNSSGAYFKLWIDGVAATDWDSRSQFQFCNTADASILGAVDSGAVKPVSIGLLPAGTRVLMVKVKDWGGATSDSAMITVTVSDTLFPSITGVAPTYQGQEYYPDGSVFYSDGATTHFDVTASAASYFGSIQAYRSRLMPAGGTAEWSAWGAAAYEVADLSPGAYRFETMCRDWSGHESAVTSYEFEIFQPTFMDDATVRVLIIDETRDGNGRVGSPDDVQSDSLWRQIFEYDTTNLVTPDGWRITELDYTNRTINPNKYVSARDVFNKDLIVWHADDKSSYDLKVGTYNLRLLSEYLDAGGKLFVCGWDMLTNFNATDVDTVVYSSTSVFAQRYLRISGGMRTTVRDFSEALGRGGYGDLHVDAAKVPAAWNGSLDRCWVITPAHRTETIAVWGGTHANTGKGMAMKNFSPLNPWRTITCGFPIYFLNIAESKPFVLKATRELLAP